MSIKYMNRVWEHSKLNKGKLMVMLALADYANDEGECWPSQPTLALKSRLTERHLQRVLGTLIQEGYIAIVEQGVGRGNHTVYQLFPAPPKDDISDTKDDIMSGNQPAKRRHFVGRKDDIFDTKDDILSSRINKDSDPPLEPSAEEPPERAAAPPPPAQKPKKPRKPRKPKEPSDPLLQHVAVQAYRDKYNRWPNEDQREAIAAVVTDEGLWAETMLAWNLKNYSPTNVSGLLDWYQHPERFRNGGDSAPPVRHRQSRVAHSLAAIDRVFDRLEEQGIELLGGAEP